MRDETCPVSTEGWTRRVHFVREGVGWARLVVPLHMHEILRHVEAQPRGMCQGLRAPLEIRQPVGMKRQIRTG